MNTEIATMCATRPEDARRARTNEALNRFEAELARVRACYPVDGPRVDSEQLPPAVIEARSRVRLREMHKRLLRVTVQLHGAGVMQ